MVPALTAWKRADRARKQLSSLQLARSCSSGGCGAWIICFPGMSTTCRWRPALLRLKAMGGCESAPGAEQSPRICAHATASLRPSHELGCLQEQAEDVQLKAQQPVQTPSPASSDSWQPCCHATAPRKLKFQHKTESFWCYLLLRAHLVLMNEKGPQSHFLK